MKIRLFKLIIIVAIISTSCKKDAEKKISNNNSINYKEKNFKINFGEWGFDLTAIDSTVNPGDDFFLYTNGNWVKKTQIPSSSKGVGMFSQLQDTIDEKIAFQIKQLVIENSSKIDEHQKLIKNWYTAYMDTIGLRQNALQSLKNDIAEIYQVKNKADLIKLMGSMNKNLNVSPLRLYVSQSYTDPTKLQLSISASIEDCSFLDSKVYKDPSQASIKEKHKRAIASAMTSVGLSQTLDKAKKVQNLETKLISCIETTSEKTFTEPATNSIKIKDMILRYPGLDWKMYFKGAEISENQEIFIDNDLIIKRILILIEKEPLQSWQDMLAYQLINKMSPYLPVSFEQADFEIYQKSFGYASKMQQRDKICIIDMSNLMPMQIGKLFVENYIDEQTKPKIKAMTREFIEVYKKHISSLKWMSNKGKAAIITKLNKTKLMVGYPDKWPSAPNINFTTNDAYKNVRLLKNYNWNSDIKKLGKPIQIDPSWDATMGPHFAGATANPVSNLILISAGICLPPFFDTEADDAVNYGAIGVVIAHEISHLFDVNGRKFDENGKMQETWTPSDIAKYNKLTSKLAVQMSSYEVTKGSFVNGNLTLAESIADLGGLQIAYEAYTLFMKNKPSKKLNGFTNDQRFFLAFSQNWRQKTRPEALISSLNSSTWPPNEVRPYMVRNLDSWYTEFHVLPTHKLYLSPENRIKIW